MPVAVAQVGWLLGVVVMTLLLAMNVHVSILLWRAKMRFPKAETMTQLVHHVFAKAPPAQRQAATWAAGVSQYAFICCNLGVFVLTFGKGLGMLFYEARICLPVLVLLGCALIAPLHGSVRNMGAHRSVIWLNIATLVGTIAIPLAYMAYNGVEEVRPEGSSVYAVSLTSLGSVMKCLSITTFGFTSQFILVEVMHEMKEPADFPKAYAISAPFQFVAFMVVGLMGYYYMGDKVKGNVFDTLPFGPLLRVAAVCLTVHMLISYLIKSIVACKAIHVLVDGAHARLDSARAWAGWNGVMLSVMLVSWLIANLCPFFADLTGLLGASVTPVCCYLVPIACFLRLQHDLPAAERSRGRLEYAVLALELAFALTLMVFGTQDAIDTISASWETYGYPFECHCEDVWNTCACSADHAGMEDVCAPQHQGLSWAP